jgi:poly(A) polymerase
VDQPRFRAAFDFMRLRADAGEIDVVLSDWWQEFSMADDNLREDMVDQVREELQQRQRAPRVHKAPVAKEATTTTPETTPKEPGEDEASDAPKKRRRRKRTSAPKDGGDQAGTAA